MVSRIGKIPVSVPEAVDISINDGLISMKSSKGELSYKVPDGIGVKQQGSELIVETLDETTQSSARHGLARTIIANQLTGLTQGFQKQLEIVGTGYNAQLKGSDLVLRLGYSHLVNYPQPEGITFSIKENIITVEGIDKQLVGEVAAHIRKFRPPEPYKGKGIKYVGEQIRRKAGKAGKA